LPNLGGFGPDKLTVEDLVFRGKEAFFIGDIRFLIKKTLCTNGKQMGREQ
jgi:hypothetical protein